MRDIDNEIAGALPENGGFEPGKGDALRTGAVSHYRKAHRKTERSMMAYLLICVVFMGVGAVLFLNAYSTRQIVGAAILILIFFESTILIKLWYWIVHTMLRAREDVRLLRIDLAGLPGAEAALVGSEATGQARHGLSTLERALWWIPIFVIASAAGAVVAYQLAEATRAETMTSERIITLSADGSGQMTTRYDLPNTAGRTIHERRIYSGGSIPAARLLLPEESPITDGDGNALLVHVLPAGQNHVHVIGLARPVPPGERFQLIWKKTVAAASREGAWTFTMNQDWGYGVDYFRDVVVLPKGAEFVSADPKPEVVDEKEGRTRLYWSTTRTGGRRWEYTVQYRLPETR